MIARPAAYSSVEEQITAIVLDLLFRPLAAIVKRSSALGAGLRIENAGGALHEAIRTGRVQYELGVFTGRFSAAISGELKAFGARFDGRAGVFRANPASVPGWVSAAAAEFRERAKAAHAEIRRELDRIQEGVGAAVDAKTIDATAVIERAEQGWRQAARSLEVVPQLRLDSRARLAADYNDNAKLAIKKFAAEEVQELRSVVEESALEGYRFDALVDGIKRRYGVAGSRARFIARQETALFTSKFRRERFSEAGVTRYVWSTSLDERVRDRHKELHGRTFSYNDPPIVDTATGRRANPGEDFNCRCIDKPVIEPIAVAA